MKKSIFAAIGLGLLFYNYSHAQTTDSILQSATLDNCIHYALTKAPLLKQAELDKQITESQVRGQLSAWYPQINMDASYQNNFQRPALIFNGNVSHSGAYNQSAVQFGATQNLFNRDALLALKSKGDVYTQANQQVISSKTDIAANVAKAFYDVLLTEQQYNVINQTIVRVQRSIKDAYNQYQAGVTDKTDYQRATINLNNSLAQQKSYTYMLKAKTTYLKQLMGYPGDQDLNLVYDSLQMESKAQFDTTALLSLDNRIEYKILQTQRRLYEANLKYEKWAYIPSVSAFANYNINYLNNKFGKLYNDNLPNSYAGIQVSFPIFQGGKRRENIKQAQYQLMKTDWQIADLRNNVRSQYEQSLAYYRSDLESYNAQKENLKLAQEVYNIISLQYKSGIKTYLEVINAETDLKTAQINYANTLYQLLSDRVDLEKSLGTININ